MDNINDTNTGSTLQSTVSTRALVEQFVSRCMNPVDPSAIDDFTTNPKIRAMHAGLCTAFPDARFTPDWQVVEGNRAAVGGTLRGTHLGPWRAVPATGNAIEAMSVATFVIVDGLLVDLSVVPDTLAIAEQIGLVAKVGPKTCQLP